MARMEEMDSMVCIKMGDLRSKGPPWKKGHRPVDPLGHGVFQRDGRDAWYTLPNVKRGMGSTSRNTSYNNYKRTTSILLEV